MNGADDDSEISPRKARPLAAPPTPDPVATAAAVGARSGPDHDNEGAGGVGDRFEFTLDWHDKRRDLRWQGRFTGHVLTPLEVVQVGVTRARLLGNQPPASVDAATLNLVEVMAHLAVALDDTPKWWDPQKLRDMQLLGAVYEEVARREAAFWGNVAE